MSSAIWLGLIGAVGALVRNGMGYLNIASEDSKVKFNIKKFAAATIPAVIGAFAVAIGFDLPLNAETGILIFMGAAGFGSLQSKFIG